MWKRKYWLMNEAGDDGGEGGGGTPPQRPEHIPEKFWNSESGEVNVDAMAKGYVELERSFHESKKIPEGVPESPDGYKIDLGQDARYELDTSDPLVKWMANSAHKAKIPQDDFNNAMKEYAGILAEEFVPPEKLVESLGENGKERLDRVNAWLDKTPESAKDVLIKFATTVDRVKAVEGLMNMTGNVNIGSDDPPSNSSMLSENDLRELQKDPKYWRDHDPETVKKVQEGWQALERQAQRTG